MTVFQPEQVKFFTKHYKEEKKFHYNVVCFANPQVAVLSLGTEKKVYIVGI